MKLTADQLDRARGAVLASAAGDALGAGYEFETATLGPEGPRMIGGGLGNFGPGEWTDDTTMAWCILDVAASHEDLVSDVALTGIARRFRRWAEGGPSDIGMQTYRILNDAGPAPTNATMLATSYDLHVRTGHTGGNGSLMRTGPVALRYLGDPEGLAVAARRIGALTHYDPQAQDACALWSLAIRHAIVDGELDVRVGLPLLDQKSADRWATLIDQAETQSPSNFNPNRWVVTAFQAAWSAIHQTGVPSSNPADHLADALAAAIRIGDDTDTVAAIAGALLGARWGVTAVPAAWLRDLHGYPGVTGQDLVDLVDRTVGVRERS